MPRDDVLQRRSEDSDETFWSRVIVELMRDLDDLYETNPELAECVRSQIVSIMATVQGANRSCLKAKSPLNGLNDNAVKTATERRGFCPSTRGIIYSILRLLEPENQSYNNEEIFNRLVEAKIYTDKTQYRAFRAHLNRLRGEEGKREHGYIIWEDKKQHPAITITEAGRAYCKELEEKKTTGLTPDEVKWLNTQAPWTVRN